MKKLMTSTTVKVIALILLGFLLLSVALGIAGIVLLAEHDVYYDSGSDFRIYMLRQVDMFERSNIIRYTEAVLNEDRVTLNNYNFEERFSKENSNLFFKVVDSEGNVILANEADDTWQAEFRSVLYFTIGENNVEEYFMEIDPALSDTRETVKATIYTYVRSELVAKDAFYRVMRLVDLAISARYTLIFLTVFMAVLWVALFIFLLCAAGHKRSVEGIHLTWLDRIPLDVLLAVEFLALLFLLAIFDYSWNIITAFIWAAVAVVCAVVSLFSFTVRVKAGKWWRNTLIFRIGRLLLLAARVIVRVLANIHLYWKTALIFLGLTLIELIFFAFGFEDYIVWWVFEKILLLPVLIGVVFMMRHLQKSGEELASGNIGYQTDLKRLSGDFRRHGENLNGIGRGLQHALNEQMKSERMRTELITNVSHDIKTPLTSIINYVDLLKKEGADSENATEYLEVIDRQSARLRKLTEDLIEASKASTGSITVNAEPTDINVLLSQANGEYQSKLSERDITTVLSLSESRLSILADGRLLWRVFDNLLGNINKYAQSGTRVYLSSGKDRDGQVRITFRNISHAQLNISSDELMERFVRGDASRNTEGSGLGLSIARSLVELQGGSFHIEIDGDLFKAILIFPPYKEINDQ